MIVTNLQPPFETGGFFVRPEFRPSAQARPGRVVTKLQRNESDGGGYRQKQRTGGV